MGLGERSAGFEDGRLTEEMRKCVGYATNASRATQNVWEITTTALLEMEHVRRRGT